MIRSAAYHSSDPLQASDSVIRPCRGLGGCGARIHPLSGHRVFRGDPTLPDAWREFDAWRRRAVEHESGLTLPTACTFIDSGDGNRTQAVYEFCRTRVRERVFACKGSS